MTVRVTGVDVKGAAEQSGGGLAAAAPQVPRLPIAAIRFVSQPGQQRTAIVGPSGTVALVGARVMFARRKQNGPADTRPWVRLDFERLADIEVPDIDSLLRDLNPGVLAVITPQLALDLLHGVLTGSVETRNIRGGARVIEFNASIDKANRELRRSEDQRDDRQRLLRAAAITGDIFGGVAQLSSEGVLQHLTLRLREQPDKRTKVNLDVVLDLTKSRGEASLDPPSRERTIRVSTLSALRGNLLDQLVSKDQPTIPAGLPGQLTGALPS
ncbi:MAG: hypothetical protein Q8K63_11195 [Acidimicrobiales bacterium]|nr:hypothetical protein [Acidimicrobiales bacterium]